MAIGPPRPCCQARSEGRRRREGGAGRFSWTARRRLPRLANLAAWPRSGSVRAGDDARECAFKKLKHPHPGWPARPMPVRRRRSASPEPRCRAMPLLRSFPISGSSGAAGGLPAPRSLAWTRGYYAPRRRDCVGSRAAEHRRPFRRAQKIGNPPPLPERHADACRDPPVGELASAPFDEEVQRVLKRSRGVAKRIAAARRDQSIGGKDLVDRAREAVLRNIGGILRQTPAGIERGREGFDRLAGKQLEETDFAAGAVDLGGPVQGRPRIGPAAYQTSAARHGRGQFCLQAAATRTARDQDHDPLRRVLSQCSLERRDADVL